MNRIACLWRRAAPALWAVLAAAGLAACSSPVAPRFHSLSSAQPPAAEAPAAAPALRVELGPIGVPAAVDQPQWVLRMPDDSLRVLEQERWVAPLRDELRGALLRRLSQRWGAVDARTAGVRLPTWQLRVDVQRLETLPGREAWMEASWSLSPASPASSTSAPLASAPLACATSVREPVPTGDVLALAAAHRRAVIQLADQIGERLQALSRGEAAACKG